MSDIYSIIENLVLHAARDVGRLIAIDDLRVDILKKVQECGHAEIDIVQLINLVVADLSRHRCLLIERGGIMITASGVEFLPHARKFAGPFPGGY